MGEFAECDKKLFGLDRGQRLIVEAILDLWLMSVFTEQMGVDLGRKATFILVLFNVLVFHPFLTGEGIFRGAGRSFVVCSAVIPVTGVLATLEKFAMLPFTVLAVLGVLVFILLPAFFYGYQVFMTAVTVRYVPVFRKITGVIGIVCGLFIILQGVQCIPFLYTEVIKEESEVKERKADRDWAEQYLDSEESRGVPDMSSVDFGDAITESVQVSDTTFKIQAPMTIDAIVDHQKGRADATGFLYVYKTIRGEEARKLCKYAAKDMVVYPDDEKYEYLFLQAAYRITMPANIEQYGKISLREKVWIDSVDGKYDGGYYDDAGERLTAEARIVRQDGRLDGYFVVRVPKEAMDDFRLHIMFEGVTVSCTLK